MTAPTALVQEALDVMRDLDSTYGALVLLTEAANGREEEYVRSVDEVILPAFLRIFEKSIDWRKRSDAYLAADAKRQEGK